MVLCCDEKSQVQALDRTQPGLPMKKGRAATRTTTSTSARPRCSLRSEFTSVPELVAAIDEHVAHQNTKPKPFIWTKTAADILQKVIRARSWVDEKGATCGCLRAGR